MKAAPNLNFTVVKADDKSLSTFVQMIKQVYQNLVGVINGNIGFGDGTNFDNISGSWINTTTPVAPNTDFTVNHNLQRLPVGYWIMVKDRAVDIYTGSVAATSTAITLRATVASAVVRLFIIGLLLVVFSPRSAAQGANHTNIAFKIITPSGASGVGGNVTSPISGAVITVCIGSTLPSPGVICSPVNASLFSNPALTTGITNPTSADTNGNYTFWAAANVNYVISVSGVGIVTYSYVWTAPPAGGSSISTSGVNTFTNTNTFTGTTTATNLNGIVVVDGTKYTTIQAGLAAAPAGGTVIVPAGCSGAVAAPAATVLISQSVRLTIQCNITSSQVPNISIQSSGVIIEGSGGNSPSGGATDAIVWTNSGTGNTVIYGDGVTSFRGLIIQSINFRDSGAHSAARSILFKPNAADISIRDVDTVGISFDGSAGNQELVRFERARVNNYVNSAYEFNCTAFCNSIAFNSTYADLGTGSPGAGYDLGNGNFILQATDSDFAPVCGYRFTGGGSVTAQGTDDEQGAAGSAGWCITGGGSNSNVTLVSPKAVAEVLAISITGGSNVTIINPNVVNSGTGIGSTCPCPSTNSISLGAGAVGQNFLYGPASLDKPISGINFGTGVTLQTFGVAQSSANGYSLSCTLTVPCVAINADTITNGAALQIANQHAGGSSYNIGELFAVGTLDFRSTAGGGGFSFNSNAGAGRGIFTFTNTADRIYTFPNAASLMATFASAPAGTKCLHSSGTTGLITETASDCAGAPSFSAITSGTNTTAAMVVGTGASFALTGTSTLSIGSVGGTSGTINLLGTTSGTATITGPAVAGTLTNPVISSNAFQAGSPGGAGGVLLMGGSTSGTVNFTAPGVAGTSTNPITISNSIQLPTGTVYNWNADTGLSRDSAGVVDVGNGTAGNKTGTLNDTTENVTGTATIGTVAVTSKISLTSLADSITAPTIAAAGCGGAAATITNANGTAAFEIGTGTTPTSGGCTITMPAAAHSWTCSANSITAPSTTNFVIIQTGAISTTSVVLQQFSDVAAAAAPTASDTWRVMCRAN